MLGTTNIDPFQACQTRRVSAPILKALESTKLQPLKDQPLQNTTNVVVSKVEPNGSPKRSVTTSTVLGKMMTAADEPSASKGEPSVPTTENHPLATDMTVPPVANRGQRGRRGRGNGRWHGGRRGRGSRRAPSTGQQG